MIINNTFLGGVAEIETTPEIDDRGWFTRYFCQHDLLEINGNKNIVQINSSFTKLTGTIRGLHFQNYPHEEDKIVRCLSGKVFEVIVDIRDDSPTYGQWKEIILDADIMNMVYVPKGFAHGFQTLTPNCHILYLHTQFHYPEAEDGFHYASPELNIKWPLNCSILSTRDKNLNTFKKKL
jgi:dTDP-4-dehydrorhamnose 3,5-epimerase